MGTLLTECSCIWNIITDAIASSGRAVQMFEIEIEHICGKEVQEK